MKRAIKGVFKKNSAGVFTELRIALSDDEVIEEEYFVQSVEEAGSSLTVHCTHKETGEAYTFPFSNMEFTDWRV